MMIAIDLQFKTFGSEPVSCPALNGVQERRTMDCLMSVPLKWVCTMVSLFPIFPLEI